jgi:hypothetical protein
MGDRLLGFPIERYKYRRRYNIGKCREESLQGLDSIEPSGCTISVALSYFVL